MSEVKNVILSGVGGQGTILASKLLSIGLIQAGFDVKMSEVHGMAQRGGSVTTQVRYGEEVASPIIGKGSGDLLVSFEKMEALRYLDYLKPGARVVVNDDEQPSAPILTGAAEYPEGILEELRKHAKTVVIPATKIAAGLGNEKVMNVVLLGALVKAMELTQIDWRQILRENVKPQFVDMNIKALEAGMEKMDNE